LINSPIGLEAFLLSAAELKVKLKSVTVPTTPWVTSRATSSTTLVVVVLGGGVEICDLWVRTVVYRGKQTEGQNVQQSPLAGGG